ncbi:exported hypothetical protein [Candidatus Zixiibacteriota bacterium]|nr:exported hypothetical protein [candidate division Zixibacteria bacterium]
MTLKKMVWLAVGLLLLLSSNLWAQKPDDKFGVIDTIYIEPYKIDGMHWGINVSLVNDEEIVAMSIPLALSAGKNRVVADSTIFKGGRADSFKVKMVRVDTTSQCVTIGLIADMGVSVPPIPAGKGRIATVFVSSLDGKDISALKVDTTTTPPGNNLQLVKQPSDGIIPAVVIKTAGKDAPMEKEAEKPEKK